MDRILEKMTAQHKADCFDALRLYAASAVLFSHHFALLGEPEPYIGGINTSLGGLSVFFFFIISGYVNGLSILYRKSLPTFLFSRVMRIYPGMIVCMILTVILGYFLSTAPFKIYFYSEHVKLYLLNNSTLLYDTLHAPLPGLFEKNPMPSVVNGSIWTIPYEMSIYIAFGLLLWICHYRPFFIILSLASMILIFHMQGVPKTTLPYMAPLAIPTLFNFGIMFMMGASVAAVKAMANLRFALMALAVMTGALFLFNPVLGWFGLTACITLGIGSLPAPRWLVPKRDLSYGIYLYAFPMQQAAISLTHNFALSLGLAAVMTAAFAYLSSRFVERPALRLKERVITAAGRLASEAQATLSGVPAFRLLLGSART